MKKRILSLVLAVLMIATLLPVSASALTMSRDDGTWLFPAPSSYYNAFSDWAGCPGWGTCPFCHVVHSAWGDDPHTGPSLGHNGVDIGVPYGTNVYAAAPGTIYWKNTNWGERGYTVVIEHPTSNGYSYYSYYQHLSNVTLKPNKSQVAAGDIIAKSGNSGGSKSYDAHLHFGIVIASPGLGEKMADMTSGQLNRAEGQGWLTTTGKSLGRILTNPSAKSQVPTGDPAVVPPLKAHNGVILKLRFKVLDGVEDGDIQVNMLYSIGDIANYDEKVICPDIKAGTITVGSVLPGDFNGDGVVNALDLLRLKKFLAGDSVEMACSGDVTGDDVVNALDLLRVKKFLAGNDVELH